jgi:hypothetical protein
MTPDERRAARLDALVAEASARAVRDNDWLLVRLISELAALRGWREGVEGGFPVATAGEASDLIAAGRRGA